MQGTQLVAQLWPPIIDSEAYMQHHQQRMKCYPGHVHVLHEQPHSANPAVPAKKKYCYGNPFATVAKDSNSFCGAACTVCTAMENYRRGCSMPSYDAVVTVYNRKPQQGTYIHIRVRACELRVSLPSARSARSWDGLMHAAVSSLIVLWHIARTHCSSFWDCGEIWQHLDFGARLLLGRLGSFAQV